MILQGNVRGGIYPVVQKPYDEPIDATRRCAFCGRKFVPGGKERFCSERCRTRDRMAALTREHEDGRCAVCGAALPMGKFKYCSDMCARKGKNARNRVYRMEATA